MSDRDYLTAIGTRIAAARKNAGVTQVKLADAVGLSRASIANIEVGNQDTTLTNMAAIARALGVTCDHLVRDPGDDSGSAWIDLAKRVTADEREAERLSDKAWRELDAFEAILQRGIAKGLDRARTHQLAIAVERRASVT
jgi:transcriptional regulator with XRE-family HTH domain